MMPLLPVSGCGRGDWFARERVCVHVYRPDQFLPLPLLEVPHAFPPARDGAALFGLGLPELLVCSHPRPLLQVFEYFWPLTKEEFLEPMGLSQYRLAKEIGVPAQRIGEIVAGKRAITADTDLRLCRFFGLSNGYWLRAQAAYDIEVAEDALSDTLKKIKPWSGLDAKLGHTA